MANIEKPKVNTVISIIVINVDQMKLSNIAFGYVKWYHYYWKFLKHSLTILSSNFTPKDKIDTKTCNKYS